MISADILLVVSDDALGEELRRHLTRAGHRARRVPNDEQGVNALVSNRFSLLIADLDRARVDGLRLLSVARDRDATMPVVLLAETLLSEQVLQAYDVGVTAVLAEPIAVDLMDRVIEQGLTRQGLEQEIVQLKRQLDTRHALTNLIGPSHQMATLHDQIREAAPGEVPIILLGEPGTGRDHLAQIIHNQSARSRRSFVKVTFGNNAAGTIERELFGCGAGVYAEAPEGSPGRIESADEGSLYLDQLASLTPIHGDLLLSCLESGTVRRLGESRDIQTRVRLIVSVNSPLDKSDPTHRFLDQLQQTYGALTIEIAPLRDRVEDIAPLIEYFAERTSARMDRMPPRFEAEVVDTLSRHSWPGNLRELENVVGQMVRSTKADGWVTYRTIPASLLGQEGVRGETVAMAVGSSMHDAERAMIEATMRACDHNKEACAEQLGIGLRTLYRKLKEYRDDES